MEHGTLKGHQKGPNLTRQAQLNNIADALANKTRESLPQRYLNIPPPQYPASLINATINKKFISQDIDMEMQQAFTSYNLQEFIEEKFQWQPTTADL
eukprot:2476136-Ditylum_brightwellii.AAC.1